MRPIRYALAVLTAIPLLLTSACVISQMVKPAEPVKIDVVYVHAIAHLHMSGLLPEVARQLEAQGFKARVVTGDLPADAVYHLEVTANWNWDMAMYLTYFRATLYRDDTPLGVAEYDARFGGANLEKFGTTAAKIRPLLTKLMSNAVPAKQP